jgi:hypothetical protein
MKRSSRLQAKPAATRPIATWRQIENAIVEYFRAEGGRIAADRGESYLIINKKYEISLSDIARKLTDPTS